MPHVFIVRYDVGQTGSQSIICQAVCCRLYPDALHCSTQFLPRCIKFSPQCNALISLLLLHASRRVEQGLCPCLAVPEPILKVLDLV